MENNEIGETKKSSMFYIISAVLLLLVVGGGIYLMNKGAETKSSPEEVNESIPTQKPTPPSLKGQKLSDSQFADSAHQIYPGKISEAAKAAMSGWDLKTIKNSDGTITASLIPAGSEVAEGDSAHTYTLQPTDKLYFVDLNPGDDNPGAEDANTRDDLGIVVDANGIIQ